MRTDVQTRRRHSRRGDTLVSCLIALAIAVAVFLPALALLRRSIEQGARADARAEAEAAVRPAARSAATQLRLGVEVEKTQVREVPLHVETRVRELSGEDLPEDNPPQAVTALSDGAAATLVALPARTASRPAR